MTSPGGIHHDRSISVPQGILRETSYDSDEQDDFDDDASQLLQHSLSSHMDFVSETPALGDFIEQKSRDSGSGIWYKYLSLSNQDPQWLDEKPAEKEAIGLKSQDDHAEGEILLVRQAKIKDDDEDDATWRTISFEVRSEHIVNLINHALAGYPDIPKIASEYKSPFEPFFHRLEAIRSYANDTSHLSDVAVDHVQRFISFLELELAPTISASTLSKESGQVSFKHAWTRFEPGILITYWDHEADQIMELTRTEYELNLFSKVMELNLTGRQVNWNGQHTGFEDATTSFRQFKGMRKVDTLAAVPLDMHPDKGKLKQRLLARGKQFASLRGSFVKLYKGVAWADDPHAASFSTRVQVYGRVIVDAFAFFHCQDKKLPPYFGQIISQKQSHCDDGESIESNASNDRGMEDLTRNEDVSELNERELLLCTNIVYGFSLDLKRWLELDIAEIHEVPWASHAFDQLAISPTEKELLLAFSEASVRSSLRLTDFVHGKGSGTLILLCGPPGVGKTFTAEALAEKIRTGLYTMSAADIGTNPGLAEERLQAAFKLCKICNALLLIDEADVFLTTRRIDALEQNSLVSVFLRMLERYDGLMFMTTNRRDSIDSAVASRIDLIINFTELGLNARKRIWSGFLAKVPENLRQIEASDIDVIARESCNGRDIKSTVKLCRVLAERNGKAIDVHALTTMLRLKKGDSTNSQL